MTEEQVKNAVVTRLGQMKCKVVHLRALHEHGCDIVARFIRYPKFFHIEAKGDPSARHKRPESGREVNFMLALGQILLHMTPKGGKYGIAFPNSYRQKVLKRVPWKMAKHLQLHAFLVRSASDVDVLTWKDLKERQESKPSKKSNG